MQRNRLSGRPVWAVPSLALLLVVAAVALESGGDRSEVARTIAPVAWEYAQLEYQGTLTPKGAHHLWQWISSEEGVEAFEGRSEISTIRDLCHAISKEPVDAQSSEARNTHIILLDTIGRKGWEMVDHFETVRDLAPQADANASDERLPATSITWQWSFKRPK